MNKAMNRVDGVMKGISGFGLVMAGVCGAWAGLWFMLPLCAWGGIRLGNGTMQALTGWSDDAD